MENTLSAPAIPLRGLVPIPGNDQKIEIGRKVSLNALEIIDSTTSDELVVLLIQKDPAINEPTPNDFEKYGVLAER